MLIDLFKNSPKVNNIFMLILYDNLLTRTLKNRPNWSRCLKVKNFKCTFDRDLFCNLSSSVPKCFEKRFDQVYDQISRNWNGLLESMFFQKMCHSRPLFHLFSSFETNITNLTATYLEKYVAEIWIHDLQDMSFLP